MNYYADELAKINLAGKYPAALQMRYEGRATVWMNITPECAAALVDVLLAAFGPSVLPCGVALPPPPPCPPSIV